MMTTTIGGKRIREERQYQSLQAVRTFQEAQLKRLIRHRLRRTRQHRLHRLALAVAEHPKHVRAQREPLRLMAETALERLEPPHQPLNPHGCGAIDHRAAA